MDTTGTRDIRQNLINESMIRYRVAPAELDRLLAEGWRHFGERFVRYNYSFYKGDLMSVVPLRLRLRDFKLSKSKRRNLKRNADLDVEIRPAEIDDETHQLFAWHRTRFDIDRPQSIYTFFSEMPWYLPTDAMQLRVRIGSQLVAESFFECGSTSISSVYATFYPEILDRGLGVFTMLKEIEHARDRGLEYYYPGYAYHKPSLYDYKRQFPGLEEYNWIEWKDAGIHTWESSLSLDDLVL